MKTESIVVENWLTRKPDGKAFDFTAFLSFFLIIASMTFQMGMLHAQDWMPASAESVFTNHQYWRAWTSLFAHGDLAHIVGNLILFIPFTYYLSGYFGKWVPTVGILFGGAINLLVLRTMPMTISLIGISGVVYWLGAAWITLFVLVDRREPLRRRLAKAVVVTLVIFMPETYKPEISYLSHLLGFIFGIGFALLFYAGFRKRFQAAERIEYRCDPEEENIESKTGEKEGDSFAIF